MSFLYWVATLIQVMTTQMIGRMRISPSESDENLDECENQAVVTPGRSRAEDMDRRVFHARFGHAHDSLLKSTARSMGVKLTAPLHECEG